MAKRDRASTVELSPTWTATRATAPLPPGWIWARLGDVADIVMGNSPPGSSYNTEGRGVPLINGPTEFGPGQLDHPDTLQYTDAPSRHCEPGDLLVCVRGSTTGRTNVASFRACIGRGVAAVRAYECQPYISQFVASQASHLLSIGTGSTFPAISSDQLRSLAVPLPPLADQQRIVAAIEQALADVNAGVRSLEQAREDLAQLRASTLQAAFRGELVHRTSGKRGGTGAQLMLARIKAERERRSPATRTLESELFTSPAPHATSQGDVQPNLPDGWTSATLGEICEIQLGRAKNPSNRSGRYATPYLRAANITEDGLNLANVLQMDFPPREREAYRLHGGDLIISEASGSPDQVGKPAVWNDELPLCCFQNTVVRLRPVILSSDFVLAFLQHCYVNGIFASLAAGVGINHLGASRLSRIVVPVPPEDVQAEIVAEVNRQLGAARASRDVINAILEAAQLLRRSVLERAFAGGLVKPAASAETATRLLEKLRARRTEAASKPKAASTVRRVNPMTFPPERRPLLDVIREHPAGITPEELLTAANYSADTIDDFYAELARIAGAIVEEKPSGDDLVRWPAEARVLLRAKAG